MGAMMSSRPRSLKSRPDSTTQGRSRPCSWLSTGSRSKTTTSPRSSPLIIDDLGTDIRTPRNGFVSGCRIKLGAKFGQGIHLAAWPDHEPGSGTEDFHLLADGHPG